MRVSESVTDHGVTEELVTALRGGLMRLSRRLRQEHGGTDLSLTQLSALGTLRRRGALTIGELASTENVKPPAMSRTVSCLEALKLVSRRPSESDGRHVVVRLTAAAEAVLGEHRRRRDAWLRSYVAEMTEGERDLLGRAVPLLDAMAQE